MAIGVGEAWTLKIKVVKCEVQHMSATQKRDLAFQLDVVGHAGRGGATAATSAQCESCLQSIYIILASAGHRYTYNV